MTRKVSRKLSLETELRLIQMVSQGFTHKAIGIELGLSFKTVEQTSRAMRQRLGLRSMADLVHYAIHHGIDDLRKYPARKLSQPELLQGFKPCPYCLSPFKPKRGNQRYCQPLHQKAFWRRSKVVRVDVFQKRVCKWCNSPFRWKVTMATKNQKQYCREKCRLQAKSRRWSDKRRLKALRKTGFSSSGNAPLD